MTEDDRLKLEIMGNIDPFAAFAQGSKVADDFSMIKTKQAKARNYAEALRLAEERARADAVPEIVEEGLPDNITPDFMDQALANGVATNARPRFTPQQIADNRLRYQAEELAKLGLQPESEAVQKQRQSGEGHALDVKTKTRDYEIKELEETAKWAESYESNPNPKLLAQIEERAKAIGWRFDRDGDGKISKDEIQQLKTAARSRAYSHKRSFTEGVGDAALDVEQFFGKDDTMLDERKTTAKSVLAKQEAARERAARAARDKLLDDEAFLLSQQKLLDDPNSIVTSGHGVIDEYGKFSFKRTPGSIGEDGLPGAEDDGSTAAKQYMRMSAIARKLIVDSIKTARGDRSKRMGFETARQKALEIMQGEDATRLPAEAAATSTFMYPEEASPNFEIIPD